MNNNQEKKKSAIWNAKETECFLTIVKELQVLTLMDGKKFRTSEIFKKVEELFKSRGYNRTHTQLLDKFKAMKKRFKATKDALSVSGAGTGNINCPFFEELIEIFGHRPILNKKCGIDSIVVSPQTLNKNDETLGYYESDIEITASKISDESQSEKFMENTISRNNPSPSIVIDHKRSFSDISSHNSPSSLSISDDSRATSTPPLNLYEPDSNKLGTLSKKSKICETPTYSNSEGPRGLKNIMQNFAKEIIESQGKLLTKTVEEQRKHDQEMFNQYNNIFLQQTQMLLAGLQNLSSPFPKSYPTFQQFPGVSTTSQMCPMFNETSLHQPYITQSLVSHQNEPSEDDIEYEDVQYLDSVKND